MSIGEWFFALTYDVNLRRIERAGLRDRRQDLLAAAGGDVLEVGGGTGANLPFYGPAVASLTLTEPAGPMLHRLIRKAGEQAPQASVLRAPAEELPFDDDSFDTVVTTLVLCTVTDQPRALSEIRRVLRPGGQLLLIEHVRAADAGLARRQDRINGIYRHVAGGCHCNRATGDGLQKAGFDISRIVGDRMTNAPRILQPLILGIATPDAAVHLSDAG